MNPHDLRRALGAELAAQPDDLATHAAYADLLGEMGDPRGEFIQTQLLLEGEAASAGDRAIPYPKPRTPRRRPPRLDHATRSTTRLAGLLPVRR